MDPTGQRLRGSLCHPVPDEEGALVEAAGLLPPRNQTPPTTTTTTDKELT